MRGLLLFSAAFGLYHGFLNPSAMNKIMAVAPNVNSTAETMDVIEGLVKQSAKKVVQKQPTAKIYVTTLDESTGKPIAQHQRIVPKVKEILENSNIKVTDELSANATFIVTLCKENPKEATGSKFAVDVFKVEQGKTTKIPFVVGSAQGSDIVILPPTNSAPIVPGLGPNGETGATIINTPPKVLQKDGELDKKKTSENILKAFVAREYVIPKPGTNLKFGPNKCVEVWVAVAPINQLKSKDRVNIEDFKERAIEATGSKAGNLILNPKERYIIGVKNTGPETIGIYLEIDGMAFDKFKKGDFASDSKWAYLVKPNETTYFSGWLIDSKNISAFDVQEYPPECDGQNQKNGSIQLSTAVAKRGGAEADEYAIKTKEQKVGNLAVGTKPPDNNGVLQRQDTVKVDYVLFERTSCLTINYQQK